MYIDIHACVHTDIIHPHIHAEMYTHTLMLGKFTCSCVHVLSLSLSVSDFVRPSTGRSGFWDETRKAQEGCEVSRSADLPFQKGVTCIRLRALQGFVLAIDRWDARNT